jgi:hypothetical protein
MAIALMFEVDGKPPPWSPPDFARLQAALEALERRRDLDIDLPDVRHDICHAIGALRSILAAEPIGAMGAVSS